MGPDRFRPIKSVRRSVFSYYLCNLGGDDMKKIMIIVIIACMMSSVSLIAKELLVVRTNENYPPYEMIINSKLTGLHIDLVYAVAKRMGINVTFKSVPWKRALKMMEKGEADAVSYVGYTPERKKFLYFDDGNVLSSSNYGFIILKNRIEEINYNGDLQKMRAYKIGVQAGYSYSISFDQAEYLKKYDAQTIKQLVKMLKSGKIDLAVVDEPAYLLNRQKESWSGVTFLKHIISHRDYFVAFAKVKKLKALAGKFSKEMISFKQTDEYRKILAKYNLN